MKDMGNEELQNFMIEMTTEWYKKDALILDLRFNTGGNVHDEVLNFLSRKPYLQWKYRGGSFAPQPNFAPGEKPIVLLVNEQSLSDAEMTAAGFKALKLGKIIGTETYRWLIFTSGKSLVDGSFYRLPSWGCFTLDGKDIERNGVVPDIYVKTGFKDRLDGKDPQLERAVAEIIRAAKIKLVGFIENNFEILYRVAVLRCSSAGINCSNILPWMKNRGTIKNCHTRKNHEKQSTHTHFACRVRYQAALNAAIAETREKILSQMIGNGLVNWHFSGKKIDDDFSLKSFAQYTKYLDFGKSFLIQADLDALKVFDLKIDDEIFDGDFSLPRLGKQLLRQRVLQVKDICQEILKKPFDFSLDEQIELDTEKRNYARSLEDLKEWWFKRLKYLTLTQYLNLLKLAEDKKTKGRKSDYVFSPELEIQARKAVEKSVQRLFNRLLQDRSEDMQALYFNALLAVFDPHSQYFPPRAKEDFDIDMSGTLEGIGALLGEDDGYIKVFEVIPGSPAWIQNILKVEDIILKVGQGNDEPVDIVGMNVADAARLVRGKKGSLVRLTVKKTDGRIMQISLIRNVVEIQETYARSAVLFNEKLKKSFGYIFLPKFYHDFNRQNGRNASDDVKAELEKLVAQNVEGIILDLRNNGGGALDDAEKMSGLFIEKGPLVQLKDRNSAAPGA